MNDRFVSVNGKYYRTNTESSLSSPATVTGIAEYDSFNDLLTDTWSARHDGGSGLASDLFMVVPRAALPLGGPPPVPEIDPAGLGSILALLGGGLGLLERLRKRH